jgi:hypothetical protein
VAADPGCTRASGPHAHGPLSEVQPRTVQSVPHPIVNGAPVLIGDRVHVLAHGEHVHGEVVGLMSGRLPTVIHVRRDRPLPGYEVTVESVSVPALLEHWPATRTATPPF